MKKRRVVVTGLGAVTPVGNDVSTMWDNIVSGHSGIDFVTKVDKEKYPTKIAGEVKDYDPSTYISRRDARRMDAFTQYAVVASKMALEDVDVLVTDDIAELVGVWIGSGIGGMQTYEEQFKRFIDRCYRRVSPFFVPMMIPDIAAGQVSIQVGAKGINSCTTTACASGANAIGDAFNAIQRCAVDYMTAGCTEAPLINMSFTGF